MITIRDIVQPTSLEKAYEALIKQKSNSILGGSAFLRLGSKQIGVGIDLSGLGLDQITETEDCLEIGAMCTLRQLETLPFLRSALGGIVPKAIGNIIGVQFRNVATVGGSVFARYGFSDLLPALLALDAEVELFEGGRMPLQDFLERPFQKDILTHIRIPKKEVFASYQCFRNSASDFPVLTAAVSCSGGKWKLVVGARPRRAKIATIASEQLSLNLAGYESTSEPSQGSSDPDSIIAQASNQAAEELSFGSNVRGSAEYRQALAKVLLERAIKEVLAACKSK